MSEGKRDVVPLNVLIPSKWKEELEERAEARNISMADAVRDLTDQALRGRAAQARACQDDAARHVIRVIIELPELYDVMEREDKACF
jgi:hypothetical protein